MRYRWLGVVIWLVIVGCCAGLQHDYLRGPVGARVLPTFPMYKTWFEYAEQCSYITGDLGAIRFYYVPSSNGVVGSGFKWTDEHGVTERLAGLWISRNRIYLAEDNIADPRVVVHEMLHDLMNNGGHPRGVFVTRCKVDSGV